MVSKRLFVAIAIPNQIRNSLAACKGIVNIPGLSWVRAENLHITLLFLGETNVADLAAVEQKLSALSSLPSFELQCHELVAVTRRGKVSMIWAGFKSSKAFIKLSSQISAVLNQPPDHAPVPHITLARVKRNHIVRLAPNELPPVENHTWRVHKFGLWASVLTPLGPVYTVLQEWDLKV